MGRRKKLHRHLAAMSKKASEMRRLRNLGFLPLPKETEVKVGGEVGGITSSNFIYLAPSTSASSKKAYPNYFDEGEMELESEHEEDAINEEWKPEIKAEPVSDNEDELPEDVALPSTQPQAVVGEPEGHVENHIDFQSEKVKPASCEKPLNRTLCLLCSGETQLNFKCLSSNKDSQVEFIMKKMLEVPQEVLETHLKVVGHPREWVTFCKQCKPLVSKAYDVQKMITELEGKLKMLKDEMKSKVRNSYLKNQSKPEEGLVDTTWNKHSVRVTKETWSHVANEEVQFRPRQEVTKNCTSASSRRKQAIMPKDCDNDIAFSPNPCPSPVPDSYEDSMDVVEYAISHVIPRLANQFPSISRPTPVNSSPPKPELKKGVLETEGYRCVLCPGLKPMQSLSFTKHVSFHQERPFKCKDCSAYSSGSEIELTKRPNFINKKNGVNDDHVCSQESLVPVEFKCEKIWECEHCSETFDFEEERNSHEQHGHQEEPKIELSHNCKECSRRFRSIAEWRLHRVLEHPELSKFSCLHCDEIFKLETKEGIDLLDEPALRKHLQEVHANAEKLDTIQSECDICGENFKSASDLKIHLEGKHDFDMTTTQLFPCPICFKRFFRRANWKVHLQLSHGKKPKEKFICDVCAYETVVRTVFQEHKFLKHGIEPDGRPPRECTVEDCGFRCVVKSTLDVHMMKEHGAERRLKCQHCGKGFLTNTHLREHERIHLNAETKPFQCDICGNSFALRNYLYIHKRLSHQNRPFASTHRKKPYQSKKANKRPMELPDQHNETEMLSLQPGPAFGLD